jgi:hypothetical protein
VERSLRGIGLACIVLKPDAMKARFPMVAISVALILSGACATSDQSSGVIDNTADDLALDQETADGKSDTAALPFRGSAATVSDVIVGTTIVDRRLVSSAIKTQLSTANDIAGDQNVTFAAVTYERLPSGLVSMSAGVPKIRGRAAFYAISQGLLGLNPDFPEFFQIGSRVGLSASHRFACRNIKRSAALREVRLGKGYQSMRSQFADTPNPQAEAKLDAASAAIVKSWARANRSRFVFACTWDNRDDSSSVSLISVDADAAKADVVTVFGGA